MVCCVAQWVQWAYIVEACESWHTRIVVIIAPCSNKKLVCDTYKDFKHTVYVLYIQWSIIWSSRALGPSSSKEVVVLTIFTNVQLASQCHLMCSRANIWVIDKHSVVLWPSFTSSLEFVLPRQTWPPHIPFELMYSTHMLVYSIASCVYV